MQEIATLREEVEIVQFKKLQGPWRAETQDFQQEVAAQLKPVSPELGGEGAL